MNARQGEPARPVGMFWALVRHDIKVRKGRRIGLSRTWRLTYAMLVLVVVIGAVSVEGRNPGFYLDDVWFFTFGYPFMTFGISLGRVRREWRNGTAGWWLSLSMPPSQLVLGKAISAFIHALLVYAGTYLVVATVGLYTLALQGHMNGRAISAFLLQGLRWNGLLVGIAPLMIAIGVMFAVLAQSHAKPLAPLMWVVIGGLWWVVFPLAGAAKWFSVHGTDHAATISITSAVLIPIFGGWILACAFLFLAIYLLSRHVDI